MGSDSAALPSLSILPRWKNERCGRRTVGVMGKRSDGDKKREGKKYWQWPWDDCKRGRDVNEKKKNNEGRKKRKIKAGALMS